MRVRLKEDYISARCVDKTVNFDTDKGKMLAEPGDFIIGESIGQHWIVASDDFYRLFDLLRPPNPVKHSR
jgi:hypothetical protein